MRFHKEGFKIIGISLSLFIVINTLSILFLDSKFIYIPILSVTIVFFVLVLQFFRNPRRVPASKNSKDILCPADGKIVTIEEVFEGEYFKDKRIQISVFMSPLNVHVNRYPVNGTVSYYKYHPGSYLVAWHPKSSTENERTTVVVNTGSEEIMLRQIAGAVARRIVCYARERSDAVKGADMGFIKFGSRVDIFLPLTATVNAKIDDVVKGNLSILATL